MNLNLKSNLATKTENFNILTSGLKQILSSSAYLLGLEMGVNVGCTLKIDGKHDLLTILLPEDKSKTQLSILRRACKAADDVS